MRNVKRSVGILLVILMLALLPLQAVAAAPKTMHMEGERITMDMETALATTPVYLDHPQLAPGNHVMWYDRIANLTDYGKEFYRWLCDNAAPEGVLGNPAEEEVYTITIEGTVDFTFTYDSSLGDNKWADFNAQGHACVEELLPALRYTALYHALDAYNAFDLDHPEIFWLDNKVDFQVSSWYDYHGRVVSSNSGVGVNEYTVEVYFKIRKGTYDKRQPAYRTPESIQEGIELREQYIDEILANCPTTGVVDQLAYLNRELTLRNGYSAALSDYSRAGDAWDCISALRGSYGEAGPVCEGYARAFKVLCDRLGIPCVLVVGNCQSDAQDNVGRHMWNYVEVCGAWYAVDVTWNDPIYNGITDVPVSGGESSKWFLLGADTPVEDDWTFIQSHQEINDGARDTASYTNGPELSAEAYTGQHHYRPEITPPTCLEGGYTTYRCTCGDSYTADETAATGHTAETVSGKAATCTETGLTDGVKCSACGEILTAQETIPANGHSYKSVVTAPTCTEKGYTTNTCTVCDHTYTSDEIAALGHTEETVPGYAATCTETGLTDGVKCSVCDATLTAQEEIAALGHTEETVPGKAATCTNTGLTDGVICTVCDETLTAQEEIAALGHTEETVPGYAADCTNTGLTDGVICTVCGETLTAQEEIAVLGHTEETVPGYVATCTNIGLTDGVKCSVCGEILTAQEEIPALGHTEETVPGYAADCTNTGLTDGVKCSVCGEVLSAQETIPALGHTEETVPGYAATCTETGLTDGVKCSACGEILTEQEEITALGHTEETVPGYAATCTETGLTDGVKCSVCDATLTEQEEIAALGHTEETVPGYAATCTETGLTDGVKCSVCGETLTEQEEIPALGHTEETVPGYAATCTETGLTDGVKCSVCGETLTAQETIPALGHTEETVPGYAATCTETGLTDGVICTVCGETLTAQETIPANGHSFVDGTCTVCGAADPDYVNPVVTPTIKLKYPTLVFEDEILMNVYFAASDLGDVEEMGLITYSQEVTEWNVDNAEAVIPGYTWSEADQFYYATTEGIAAKCLGDTIYFAVYYKLSDGTYGYTGLARYSPKTYAYNQLKTGSAEMKPIVVAMLKYGAAAQSYFNYNTENLVNADLTEEQNALVEAYRSDMMGTVVQASGDKLGEMVNTGGYLKRYPTISFEGAFCVNYYFQPSAVPVGDITMYIWNQNDFNAAESLTKANATYTLTMEAAGEEYLAVVEGIAAKDLDRGIYVSFCYTDGTTEYCSGVIGYSIGMYCNSQAAKTGTLADLAAATAVYGYYARELFYKEA